MVLQFGRPLAPVVGSAGLVEGGFGGMVEVRERITIFFEGSFQGLGPVVASYLRHLAASMAPFQPGPAWFQHELLRINI